MSETIRGLPCNFMIAFIRWDLFGVTFDCLTSNVYLCCLRLTHSPI